MAFNTNNKDDENSSSQEENSSFLHPDSIDPDKDFFEREGAQPGERAHVKGCATIALLVGCVLAYFIPWLGIPIIIMGLMAFAGTKQKN
tara:strand:- start:890 stop:1156 length:267 start_codon:yes stop_codon:yes gene_type:complete